VTMWGETLEQLHQVTRVSPNNPNYTSKIVRICNKGASEQDGCNCQEKKLRHEFQVAFSRNISSSYSDYIQGILVDKLSVARVVKKFPPV
jgi:hypothetical protein